MISSDIAPVRKFNRHFFTFLQEDYICRYLRAGIRLESVVRQTYSAHKVGTFRKVFTDFRVLLIQSTLCCDKSYNAVRRYLIQRFCEEVVVYQEILLVVPLVEYPVISERDVADSGVKVVVGESSFLISLYLNIRSLIELLCDTSGYAVKFNTVKAAFLAHFLRHYPEEITHAHCRLQDIPACKPLMCGIRAALWACTLRHRVSAAEAKSRKSLVNAVDYGRRGVMCVQHRAFGGGVFVLSQRFHKFLMLARPGTVVLVKSLRQTAPADIVGERFLFFGSCKSVLRFKGFQQLNSRHISSKFGFLTALAKMFVGNGEIVLFDGSFDLFGTGGRFFNRLGAFSSALYTVFSKNFLGSLNLLWVVRVIDSPFCAPYTLVYVTFGNVLFLR